MEDFPFELIADLLECIMWVSLGFTAAGLCIAWVVV